MQLNDTTKILLSFDQKLVADCLKSYLAHHKHLQVIGEVNNDSNPARSILELNPDLVIFEFMLWSAKYLDYMLKVNTQFPGLKILIISELISQQLMAKIMPYINGYVIKTCSAEKIILAIQEINSSGKYLCPKAVDNFFSCQETSENACKLTEREKEILSSWVEEDTNSEVASALNISVSTVRTHLKNIRGKLGNINRLQMMIYACSHNLLGRKQKPICPNCRYFITHRK
ncbi:response regulator transcription factor [Maribellus sp. YY47]|uniref:LuxR C-terminal-related transcriptional regulator n=1 Tax=Maribellus sp. YY47 TaxID=2929486 RepID=UPI002001207F|nr:response regulator transcription factor [Maribellus sp. YY47]MCK3685474.1 response regulator transcription factor [Maribellus sp. YY47]